MLTWTGGEEEESQRSLQTLGNVLMAASTQRPAPAHVVVQTGVGCCAMVIAWGHAEGALGRQQEVRACQQCWEQGMGAGLSPMDAPLDMMAIDL